MRAMNDTVSVKLFSLIRTNMKVTMPTASGTAKGLTGSNQVPGTRASMLRTRSRVREHSTILMDPNMKV